jgi:hypothetical protein
MQAGLSNGHHGRTSSDLNRNEKKLVMGAQGIVLFFGHLAGRLIRTAWCGIRKLAVIA